MPLSHFFEIAKTVSKMNMGHKHLISKDELTRKISRRGSRPGLHFTLLFFFCSFLQRVVHLVESQKLPEFHLSMQTTVTLNFLQVRIWTVTIPKLVIIKVAVTILVTFIISHRPCPDPRRVLSF